MIFPEPGTYPGLPGLYTNHAVEVTASGSVMLTPMAQHPHFSPQEEEEPQPEVFAEVAEEEETPCL